MDSVAEEALRTIQDCVESGRYYMLPHFTRRMDARGVYWPEILAIVSSPASVRYDGLDQSNRPKWVLSGKTPDGLKMAFVCVLDVDSEGTVTVFITAFWS